MKKFNILLSLLILCISCSYVKITDIFYEKVSYQEKTAYNALLVDLEENSTVLDTDIVIRIRLNYEPFSENKEYRGIITDKDEYRKLAREYHLSQNNKIFKKFNLDFIPNVYISKYSPYIEFQLPEKLFNIYKETILNELVVIEEVLDISIKPYYVNRVDQLEGTMVYSGLYDVYTNRTITGEGVRVGILENGIVDKDNELLSNTTITTLNQLLLIEEKTEHATIMATVIAGNNGIAPDAEIYSAALFGSMSNETDWMIENGVDVINMSFGEADAQGIYNDDSAYVDYLIDTYKVTVVAAVGNFGNQGYIANPGLSYNGIGVGSSDDENAVASHSSTLEVEGPEKPTICVRGYSIGIPNTNLCYTGTSIAAAQVTGIVCLLMEELPLLKTEPQLIKSLMISNAPDRLYGYASCEANGFDEHMGAGILNFELIDTYRYNYGTFPIRVSTAGSTIGDTSVYLQAGQKLVVGSSMLIYSGGTADSIAMSEVGIKLIGPNGSVMYTFAPSNAPDKMFKYNVYLTGTYKIRLYLLTNRYRETDKVTVTWRNYSES